MGETNRSSILRNAKLAAQQKAQKARERQLRRKPYLAVRAHWKSEHDRVFDIDVPFEWERADDVFARKLTKEFDMETIQRMVSFFVEWWSEQKEGAPSRRFFWAVRNKLQAWMTKPQGTKAERLNVAEWDPDEDDGPDIGW